MRMLVGGVLVVGAVVGWFAPGVTSAPEPAAADAAPGPDAQLALAAEPQWYGGEVTLERERDGHFYAPVRVDTRDYRMLVDTGASMVALTGDDASHMGLDWDPNALSPVARGAGGVVMGVRVELGEVGVGDFVARGVEAVIIPEGLPVSLLGQSFLSNVENVAISGDRLTLSD